MADIVRPGETPQGALNSGAMPKNYDLYIYEGDSLRFTITVKDANGMPVGLTGATAKADIKTGYADPTAVASFECSIPDPETGVVSLYLSPATTGSLASGSPYIWDFQITESGGDVRTYLTGDVIVTPQVTK
jgi:hypothetical protein